MISKTHDNAPVPSPGYTLNYHIINKYRLKEVAAGFILFLQHVISGCFSFSLSLVYVSHLLMICQGLLMGLFHQCGSVRLGTDLFGLVSILCPLQTSTFSTSVGSSCFDD